MGAAVWLAAATWAVGLQLAAGLVAVTAAAGTAAAGAAAAFVLRARGFVVINATGGVDLMMLGGGSVWIVRPSKGWWSGEAART